MGRRFMPDVSLRPRNVGSAARRDRTSSVHPVTCFAATLKSHGGARQLVRLNVDSGRTNAVYDALSSALPLMTIAL